jgi:hypothetical protein
MRLTGQVNWPSAAMTWGKLQVKELNTPYDRHTQAGPTHFPNSDQSDPCVWIHSIVCDGSIIQPVI